VDAHPIKSMHHGSHGYHGFRFLQLGFYPCSSV
jgi:hypothetical protein